MMEYKNSAREHLIALKTKGAMECFVEKIINGPTMKHNAYATLAFSQEHTETVDELSVEGIYRPSRSISQSYRLCRSTVF